MVTAFATVKAGKAMVKVLSFSVKAVTFKLCEVVNVALAVTAKLAGGLKVVILVRSRLPFKVKVLPVVVKVPEVGVPFKVSVPPELVTAPAANDKVEVNVKSAVWVAIPSDAWLIVRASAMVKSVSADPKVNVRSDSVKVWMDIP